ncbi:MAG: carotenoid biosynthesis protein [Paludibacter sp.]|nr:carotenoid biosynthesis protein [Paludibacter sp.]
MKEKILSMLNDTDGLRRFLIIFYIIGVAGMLLPVTSGLFIFLTPVALLMSFGLLMMNHQPGYNAKNTAVFSFIFISGIVVELIGVHTGLIFGNYIYGKGLGLKIFDTPLLIGMNWLLLVYTTGTIMQKVNITPVLRIAAGATMMLIYDLVLEQVAPKMDMWSWENSEVPVNNYIAWWLIAVFFHSLIELFGIKLKNPLSITILVTQFLFFVVLYLFL